MYAESLFVNGQVVTVDRLNTVTEALAVWGGRILAVGRTQDLLDLRGPKTKVIDVGGRAVLPGLIDAHAHVASQGFVKLGVDCSYPQVRSIRDIKARLREAAARTPPGQWIRAWLYNENNLEERRHPNRYDLDDAAADHPVYLGRVCYHIGVLNSKALELAGVTASTSDPQGGLVERDERGQPTGVLFEAALRYGKRASVPSPQEVRQALEAGAKDFLTHGITSVHDAGSYGSDQLRALGEASRSGKFRLRVYMIAYASAQKRELFEYFVEAGLITGFGDDRIRIGPVKRILDGDATASTAALRQPYVGKPNDRGFIYYSQEEMDDFLLRNHKAGFQLTTHAAGDRAIEIMLNGIEKALKAHPHPDPRPRIEHCAVLDPELMRRIKRLGVIPVPQPIMFYDFGDVFLKDYGDRCRYMFPCRSLMDMGVPVAGSSDCPVATSNPFMGMYEAMTRETRSGQVVAPEERVTLEQAIRMYTANGAYASFEEKVKGSLEPGKLADLVVVSGPITEASPELVRNVKAEMTVVGGNIVHDTGTVAG